MTTTRFIDREEDPAEKNFMPDPELPGKLPV